MIGLPFPRYIRCSNIYLPVMFLKIEMHICNVIINNMRIWYWLITYNSYAAIIQNAHRSVYNRKM